MPSLIFENGTKLRPTLWMCGGDEVWTTDSRVLVLVKRGIRGDKFPAYAPTGTVRSHYNKIYVVEGEAPSFVTVKAFEGAARDIVLVAPDGLMEVQRVVVVDTLDLT